MNEAQAEPREERLATKEESTIVVIFLSAKTDRYRPRRRPLLAAIMTFISNAAFVIGGATLGIVGTIHCLFAMSWLGKLGSARETFHIVSGHTPHFRGNSRRIRAPLACAPYSIPSLPVGFSNLN